MYIAFTINNHAHAYMYIARDGSRSTYMCNNYFFSLTLLGAGVIMSRSAVIYFTVAWLTTQNKHGSAGEFSCSCLRMVNYTKSALATC